MSLSGLLGTLILTITHKSRLIQQISSQTFPVFVLEGGRSATRCTIWEVNYISPAHNSLARTGHMATPNHSWPRKYNLPSPQSAERWKNLVSCTKDYHSRGKNRNFFRQSQPTLNSFIHWQILQSKIISMFILRRKRSKRFGREMVRGKKRREKREEKNKQENQDGKKGANQRKYNYFRIFIINVRV